MTFEITERDKKLLYFLVVFAIVIGLGFGVLRPLLEKNQEVSQQLADARIEKMDKEFILWILKNGRSREKKEDYKRVGAQYPDKFIQVRNRRQLRATVIRLLQLQNEKGLYAGTGSRKR